jgi:peptidoglycan/xylan/chitin deacetylase (PgdA/CDA1 family)
LRSLGAATILESEAHIVSLLKRNAGGGAVKTQVCITIDTEPSIAGAFANPDRFAPLLHQPVWGEIDGRSEALGFILRTLHETGLHATFFVESLHTAYFDERHMGRCVEALKLDGQDVQLHVHPCWLTFRNGKPDMANFVSDECAEHSEARLVEILGHGRDQLERWTGGPPVALRTGSFSVSRDVYRAMRQAGLSVASNICVGHAPPAEETLRFASGVHDIEGVREFPVTSFRDFGPLGRGRFRAMQITACAGWELRALLDAAHHHGFAYVIIVTHPFEFLKRDSFRYTRMAVNRINRSRFRGLCGYLLENASRFSVTTMDELAQEEPLHINEEPCELSGSALPSLLRSAQNALNDRIWHL